MSALKLRHPLCFTRSCVNPCVPNERGGYYKLCSSCYHKKVKSKQRQATKPELQLAANLRQELEAEGRRELEAEHLQKLIEHKQKLAALEDKRLREQDVEVRRSIERIKLILEQNSREVYGFIDDLFNLFYHIAYDTHEQPYSMTPYKFYEDMIGIVKSREYLNDTLLSKLKIIYLDYIRQLKKYYSDILTNLETKLHFVVVSCERIYDTASNWKKINWPVGVKSDETQGIFISQCMHEHDRCLIKIKSQHLVILDMADQRQRYLLNLMERMYNEQTELLLAAIKRDNELAIAVNRSERFQTLLNLNIPGSKFGIAEFACVKDVVNDPLRIALPELPKQLINLIKDSHSLPRNTERVCKMLRDCLVLLPIGLKELNLILKFITRYDGSKSVEVCEGTTIDSLIPPIFDTGKPTEYIIFSRRSDSMIKLTLGKSGQRLHQIGPKNVNKWRSTVDNLIEAVLPDLRSYCNIPEMVSKFKEYPIYKYFEREGLV